MKPDITDPTNTIKCPRCSRANFTYRTTCPRCKLDLITNAQRALEAHRHKKKTAAYKRTQRWLKHHTET